MGQLGTLWRHPAVGGSFVWGGEGVLKGSCRCGARCGDSSLCQVGRVLQPQPAAGGSFVCVGRGYSKGHAGVVASN